MSCNSATPIALTRGKVFFPHTPDFFDLHEKRLAHLHV